MTLAKTSASCCTPRNASWPSGLTARDQPLPTGSIITKSVNSSQGLRIDAQLRGGGVIAVPELQHLRTHQAEMQVSRGGARPAVETEGQGTGRVTDVLGDIGGIEHRAVCSPDWS